MPALPTATPRRPQPRPPGSQVEYRSYSLHQRITWKLRTSPPVPSDHWRVPPRLAPTVNPDPGLPRPQPTSPRLPCTGTRPPQHQHRAPPPPPTAPSNTLRTHLINALSAGSAPPITRLPAHTRGGHHRAAHIAITGPRPPRAQPASPRIPYAPQHRYAPSPPPRSTPASRRPIDHIAYSLKQRISSQLRIPPRGRLATPKAATAAPLPSPPRPRPTPRRTHLINVLPDRSPPQSPSYPATHRAATIASLPSPPLPASPAMPSTGYGGHG